MKNLLKIFICCLLVTIAIIFFYPRFSTQKCTPNGEYLYSVQSPYDEKKVNIYLFNGGATTGYYIRCEAEFKNGKKIPNYPIKKNLK